MSQDRQKASAGWTNYETWCVSQWLPSEAPVWEKFRQGLRQLAVQRTAVRDEPSQASAAARRRQIIQLAKQLRDAASSLSYTEIPLIYCDLIDLGLTRVNWPEILEHFTGHPFPKHSRPTAAAEHTLRPLFEPGRLFTGTAQAALAPEDVKAALNRHIRGDWGILACQDRRENLRSLAMGRPLQSVFESTEGIRFWVVTEADRSQTRVLLAEDY